MLWLTEDHLMIHLLFPGLISIVLLTESKARALHVLSWRQSVVVAVGPWQR